MNISNCYGGWKVPCILCPGWMEGVGMGAQDCRPKKVQLELRHVAYLLGPSTIHMIGAQDPVAPSTVIII